MIAGYQQLRSVGFAVEQGLEARVTAQEIIEPRAGNEFFVHTDHGRQLSTVKRQLEIEDLGPRQARVLFFQFLFDQRRQIKRFVACQAQHGRQHGLFVNRAPVIDLAIEVNGETRNNRQWPLAVDQAAEQNTPLVAQGHPACQRQVAIKPRVQQHTAINLDTELDVTNTLHGGVGFELQTRTIGMGADHAQTTHGQRALGGAKGDQGGVIARHKIAAAWCYLPSFGFVQFDEVRGEQKLAHDRHCVKWSGRTLQEVEQLGIKVGFGRGGHLARENNCSGSGKMSE